MGTGGHLRRAGAALAALLALAVPAAAGGGILEEEVPKAELDTTGNDSEIVRSIPITTKPGQQERVVMSLGPDRLSRLRADDRIRVSGEVQVSTTCVARGPRCVGRRYEFNPFITARIALAGTPEVAVPSIPVSESKQVKCTQRRPQRNHHCTIALPNLETTISDPATLPCADSNQCYVNVIVGAWHRRATRGHRVVLGGDRPDGGIVQDKGRLNVVHVPPEAPAPTELQSSTLINGALPLSEHTKAKRRVVHSVEITGARKGEVLAFDADYLATIDELPFNTLLLARVIVAEAPTSAESAGIAKQSSQLRGEATEANGFNCTQGASGYSTPCTVQKAGAIRITQDAVDPAGQPVPLYLNLVAAAAPLLYPDQDVRPRHQVILSPVNGLRVARFTPPPGASRR